MTKAELIEKRMKLMPAGEGYDFYRGWMRASDALLELWDADQAEAPEPGKVVQPGNITIIPSSVQQEPSPLEVVMRLVEMQGVQWKKLEDTVQDAFNLIDAVRAEESRRAGK